MKTTYNPNIQAQLDIARAQRQPVKLRVGSIVEYRSMNGATVQARVVCKTLDGINTYAVMPLTAHPLATNPCYVPGTALTVVIR
jgi:hypothetical protein